MALFELIFLMLLTGYIFFRLWSVLGTRNGNERPPRPNIFDKNETVDQDNVIILKGRQKDSSGSRVDIVIDQDDPFKDIASKIKKLDPEFDLYQFRENAKIAYSMIIEAFVNKDRKTLKQFLDKSVFDQFSKAIEEREANRETLSNAIVGGVDAQIQDATCRAKIAEITVLFKSEQRYVTYNEKGEIADNIEEVAIPMNDSWSFRRNLASEDPTWFLFKTKSQS